jgi:sulfur carrier protein
MNLMVNGTAVESPDGITVTELLRGQKVKMPDMVSVELNGEILERAAFAKTTLKAGDTVEFLYFMGGGRGAQ